MIEQREKKKNEDALPIWFVHSTNLEARLELK